MLFFELMQQLLGPLTADQKRIIYKMKSDLSTPYSPTV